MKTLLLAAALLVFVPRSLAVEDEVPFAEIGQKFLKTRFKADKAADVPVDDVLTKRCAHVKLGIFDIAYPTWALTDKQHAEELRSIALALLQAQVHWIDWLAKGNPAAVAPKASAETLTTWVKTWKAPALGKAAAAADKDLFVMLGATEAQKQASKDLGAFLGKPDVLGVGPKTGEPLRILLAPTRLDFVQLIAYAGLVDAAQQTQLWTKEGTTWTSFWLDWTLVLALEYPPWNDDKKFETGLSMNKFEPTGMLQHTLQQAMLAFLWMAYGDSDALYMNQAQAMNMVIEVCGEINALEGEGGRGTTGAKTSAYEKFVPGGNPSGGWLPPMSAAGQDSMKTNQWHEGLGRDHFVGPLRKGQKAGHKQLVHDSPTGLDASVAKDKNAYFALGATDSMKKHAIHAPFMGEPSKAQIYPPAEFLPDYREFFRAYKSAFYWWLQTQGDPAGADASAAKWAELMRAVAVREPGTLFDDVVARIYGIPLSGKNGETDSLEWRFLDWLAKGK